MSEALATLQEAVVTALKSSAPLMALVTGVHDGPPPRARYPYLTISDALVSDWSTKTATGREIRLALTLWDDSQQGARMQQLIALSGAALETVPRDLPGWRVASAVFLRSLVSRDPAGPWAGLCEYRFRMLATA